MTEEEINKKAEKHCNEVLCNAHEKCYEFIKCRDWRSRRAGFFSGYEQALKDFEKEKAELEAQKEKMKRHCNCKHRDSEGYCEVKRTYLVDLSYDGCDKWELAD